MNRNSNDTEHHAKTSFVLTVTPNPALDLGGVVDNLKPNEKSYVYNETRSPGGNAINVARILTRLKIPVLATGFLGGSTGHEIKHLLDFEGVKNKFINIEDTSRICVTVSNQRDHRQTRLTFPGPRITGYEKDKLFRLLANQKNYSFLILGGSLPKGLSLSDTLRLVQLAKKKNIKCIIDCPANILHPLLVREPFFIKPNLTEFQELTHSHVKSIGSVYAKALHLLDKVTFICISSVEGGALLVSRNGCFFGRIPEIKIQSTVGAGDSMLGVMVAQFFKKNKSMGDILRWGLAGAAATLSHPGTASGKANEIRRLYKRTAVEKVR